jgi:hypothetical protein
VSPVFEEKSEFG